MKAAIPNNPAHAGAFKRGQEAALSGALASACPYAEDGPPIVRTLGDAWLAGWRRGRLVYADAAGFVAFPGLGR